MQTVSPASIFKIHYKIDVVVSNFTIASQDAKKLFISTIADDTANNFYQSDIFHLYAKDYLIVVDYTTNFFDISLLPDCQSSTVVTHIKRILEFQN